MVAAGPARTLPKAIGRPGPSFTLRRCMRPPVRLLALLVCLLAIAGFVGCGSDDSRWTPRRLASATCRRTRRSPWSWTPTWAATSIQALNALFQKFPLGDAVREIVLSRSPRRPPEWTSRRTWCRCSATPSWWARRTPRPSSSGSDGNGFVAAIEVSDGDKLGDLLKSTGAAEKGEQSGAKIYEADGTEFAVDGDTVVFAGSRKLLNEALARHDGDDTLDEDTFNSNLEDVGDDGIAQGYINVQSLLSGSEGARNARKVKWIGAIEGVGLNATIEGDAINLDFKIRTDPSGLTDADLPIAPGPEAPADRGPAGRDRHRRARHRADRELRRDGGPGGLPVRLRRLRRGQDPDRAAPRRGRGEGHPRPALRRHLGQHLARGQVRRARRAQGPGGVRAHAGEDRRRAPGPRRGPGPRRREPRAAEGGPRTSTPSPPPTAPASSSG